MSEKRRLKQAYKNIQNSQLPDLWSRIEEGLGSKTPEAHAGFGGGPVRGPKHRPWLRYSTCFAAVLCLLLTAVFGQSLYTGRQSDKGMTMETTAAMASETISGEKADADGAGSAADVTRYAQGPEAPAGFGTGAERPDMAFTCAAVGYGDLSVTGTAVLPPESAVYDSEEGHYFTEDILKNTDLLCQATVNRVSYENGPDGTAQALVYELAVEQLLFDSSSSSPEDGADGSAEFRTLAARSPLVSSEGNQPLYALKQGGRYVLPLTRQSGAWQLTFPYAPQIEATSNGGYVFHTGWQSLVTDDAVVVMQEPAARDDFYYDRMIFRQDPQFLLNLTALMKTKRM